ncbi:Lyso-phosphatidylcholine acyltransferase [Coemansia sp. RSA 1290]|nr:Lyso-phosphatidylcholine acyltransferase [Coemansia sp. RSA 1290]KAJ2653105.1 Lyso-phosphatidylcholine acyltransferase [Coemansia sp. RSA 1250]
MAATTEQRHGRGHLLIEQLPRETWQERSFAYWAEKQYEGNSTWWRPLSAAVVGTTTALMSGIIKLGFRKVTVENLHKLTDVLESPDRSRPLLTVANHESTLDDPLIWGIMPAHLRWQPETTRWTLGARELLYKNPVLNAFFALGQTIPTVRGEGIWQLAVEIGLRKLDEGRWVHVFPEGRVNQEAQLLRFKWGVSRMIMEAERTPIVVPMAFRGMKEIMPLGQKVPLPRPSPFTSELRVRFGDSIDFGPLVLGWRRARSSLSAEDAAELDRQVRISIADRLWTAVNGLREAA